MSAEFERDCRVLRLCATDDRRSQEKFSAISFSGEVDMAIREVLSTNSQAKMDEIKSVISVCIGEVYQQCESIIECSRHNGDSIRKTIHKYAFGFATKWTQAKGTGSE